MGAKTGPFIHLGYWSTESEKGDPVDVGTVKTTHVEPSTRHDRYTAVSTLSTDRPSSFTWVPGTVPRTV